MSVRKGEPWGGPATGPADVTVAGTDADLAAVVGSRPGARVAFSPGPRSDLARALGVAGVRLASHEVPVDGMRLDRAPGIALNMVVLGTPPDRLRRWTRAGAIEVVVDGRERFRGRATTVVIANGQFLRHHDVVPRGHPGDGRVEVQVYALGRGERGAMKRRLPTGAHLPHPRIRELSGRRIEVRVAGRPLSFEADGVAGGRSTEIAIEVIPNAVNVLV